MTKALNKLGIEMNFFNLIKDVYEELTVDVILCSAKLNDFPPKMRCKTRLPILAVSV